MLVATTCPACNRAHAWRVDDRVPPAGGQVAHFLVPAARMWDEVVYTCGNQRIFCSEDCVASWLNELAHQRGSVLDLETLWRLAAGWYAGRLERGMSAASRAPLLTICAVSGSPARSGVSARGDRWRAPWVPVMSCRPGTTGSPDRGHAQGQRQSLWRHRLLPGCPHSGSARDLRRDPEDSLREDRRRRPHRLPGAR